MSYISPKTLNKAKDMDLLTYLQTYEPDELVSLGQNVYCTRSHDSLKLSNGMWMWWSRGFGGRSALDYLIKVKGLTLYDAVERIVGQADIPPPDKYIAPKTEKKELHLPLKNLDDSNVRRYLLSRGIDEEIIDYCFENNIIYEDLNHHNCVFVGYDENGVARYAAYRATNGQRLLGDYGGSDKQYSFRLVGNPNGNSVHIFEGAVDLLSYATLIKDYEKDFRNYNLVSLSGVYQPNKKIEKSKIPVALTKYLETHPDTKIITLHFDDDKAGRLAAKALRTVLPNRYKVIDKLPLTGKDVNDFLCIKKGIYKEPKEQQFNKER